VKQVKYYCIGIKGAGMSTLAQILYDLGNDVTGYDDVEEYKFTQDGLDKRKIQIASKDTITELSKDTIVTYSKAFSEDHPEIRRVKELGLKMKSYHELLGDLSKMFDTICVSGTHGKTTTSTLITHLLQNEMGCNYFIGDGSGYAKKENNLFVLESCEYQKHFLSYQPTYSIITNIELEHTECYDGIEDIRNTFSQFASKTKNKIIACGDDENIRKISFERPIVYYGFDENNDIVAKNVVLNEQGSTFDVWKKETFIGTFSLPLYGEHMVLDALAAITLGTELDLSYDTMQKTLVTFENARRRFKEQKIEDCIIIDDYAHHPTEIKATSDALNRKQFNESWVVFQPHTYSRLKNLLDDFADSLLDFDHIILTDVYAAREKNIFNITSKDLADKINALGKPVQYISNFENIVNFLQKSAKPKDIILTLGAGTVTDIGEQLLK